MPREDLAALISQFETIELDCTYDSPISIRRDYLMHLLGIDSDELSRLLARARSQKLLTRLRIDKDYRAWLRATSNKGCLVLMTCVEKGDYDRESLPRLFLKEVLLLRDKLINGGYRLDDVVLMPNAHLTPGENLEEDGDKAKAVIASIKTVLQQNDLKVLEGSFGFGKRVTLVIRGHTHSYTFHSL